MFPVCRDADVPSSPSLNIWFYWFFSTPPETQDTQPKSDGKDVLGLPQEPPGAVLFRAAPRDSEALSATRAQTAAKPVWAAVSVSRGRTESVPRSLVQSREVKPTLTLLRLLPAGGDATSQQTVFGPEQTLNVH